MATSSISRYYPVFLDMKGKKCVVVGGGEVAERKVMSLLDHGAATVVISPAISQGLRELEAGAKIEVRLRDYRRGDLDGAVVAIAATDDRAANARVSDEAKGKGMLINVVDDPELSNFIVPSLVRRGDISIAISTSGKSPALARKLRTELERALPAEYAMLAELVSEVRAEVRKRGLRLDGDVWQQHLDLDALIEMLKRGDFEKAREDLLSRLVASSAKRL